MATSIVAEPEEVVVGVDTHADLHVGVVLSSLGARLGSRAVATTVAGFRELADWARGFGPVRCFGVEGTGSYGAALARHLRAAGHTVVGVVRPDRRTRRLQGKSDPVDAEAAARAVLAGTAKGCPKDRRRSRRDDPVTAGGAPIGPQGKDPGDEPAPGAGERGSQDQELRGAADQGGAVQEGDHPVSQAICGEGGLSPSRGA